MCMHAFGVMIEMTLKKAIQGKCAVYAILYNIIISQLLNFTRSDKNGKCSHVIKYI